MNINSITISGRLTKDPELRHTQGGKALCKATIAWNVGKKNADGEWEDGPGQFLDLTAWEKLGEGLAQLDKGALILVTGQLQYETWEKDGQKRSKHSLKVQSYGPVPDTKKSSSKGKSRSDDEESDDL